MRATEVTLAAMLAFTGTAADQEPDQQRIDELIEKLENGPSPDAALHELVAIGAPAAERLQAEVERGGLTPALLRTVGEMGPHGTSSIPSLMKAVEHCPPEMKPEVFHAIYSLLPYLPREQVGPVSIQVRRAHLACVAKAGSDHVHHRLGQELYFGSRRSVTVRLTGRPDSQSSFAELLGMLNEPNHNHYRHELAAELLGRMGKDAGDAVPSLLWYMGTPVDRHHVSLLSGGYSWEIDSGPDSHKRFAEAILRIDPQAAKAVAAHGYLVQHGDSFQSRQSMEILRGLGEAAGNATVNLAWVAEDPGADAALRYDAISTLGILGAAARDAIPALKRLAAQKDRQLSERAKVALRQIGR